METKSSLIASTKNIIYEFQLLTNKILTKTQKISDQYSNLDVILKYNFDNLLSYFISTAVTSILNNLEIYYTLSIRGEITQVDPIQILNQAEEERKKLGKNLEGIIKSSFLINEIKEKIKNYKDPQDNKFKETNEQIKKEIKKEREEEEKNLEKIIFELKVEKSKVYGKLE